MPLRKKSDRLLFIFIASATLSGPVYAQNAWTPRENQLFVRPSVLHGEYASAYLGSELARYDDNVRITAGSLAFEYGLSENWSLDLTAGFARLGRHRLLNRPNLQSPEVPDRYGWLDTRAGLRYKITDELESDYAWMPTLVVRLGAIKHGDYDREPQSLGDGASGAEANVFFSRDLDFAGLGIYGEGGYRRRESPVPDDALYAGGFFLRLGDRFFITIGGRGQVGQGGYKFADPRAEPPWNYFNLSQPALGPGLPSLYDLYLDQNRPAWGRQETFHSGELSLGFSTEAGHTVNIFASHVFAGYNTPVITIGGLAVNLVIEL